jgi:ribulose-phosphate 3-epimerase
MSEAVRIAPSILSADCVRLGAQLDEVVAAGARVVHFDVMDGHFVPSITVGPLVLSALREHVGDEVDLDVHLMVERPERQVAEFAKAGASGITFHAEATPHIGFTVNLIREQGCRAGVAICPATPPTVFVEQRVDLALVMSVNPGWGGQKYIPSEDKIARVARLASPVRDGSSDESAIIQVDGGIDERTAPLVVAAGARLLVAGAAVFGSPDPGTAYTRILAAAESSL